MTSDSLIDVAITSSAIACIFALLTSRRALAPRPLRFLLGGLVLLMAILAPPLGFEAATLSVLTTVLLEFVERQLRERTRKSAFPGEPNQSFGGGTQPARLQRASEPPRLRKALSF